MLKRQLSSNRQRGGGGDAAGRAPMSCGLDDFVVGLQVDQTAQKLSSTRTLFHLLFRARRPIWTIQMVLYISSCHLTGTNPMWK